jgi:hypothetical protein
MFSPDYRGVMYKFNVTTCFGRLATIIRSTRARVRYMQRNVPEHNGIPLFTILADKCIGFRIFNVKFLFYKQYILDLFFFLLLFFLLLMIFVMVGLTFLVL